jgi:hypothetical protein
VTGQTSSVHGLDCLLGWHVLDDELGPLGGRLVEVQHLGRVDDQDAAPVLFDAQVQAETLLGVQRRAVMIDAFLQWFWF